MTRLPWSTLSLLLLLLAVQYGLWIGGTGLRNRASLSEQLAVQVQKNDEAKARNARLLAEVSDLREGLEIVEEKARAELGMIKPDEILVQITRRP